MGENKNNKNNIKIKSILYGITISLSLVIAAIGIVYVAIYSKMSKKKKVVASILLMLATVCQIYFYNTYGVFDNIITTDYSQENVCDDEDDDYDEDEDYSDEDYEDDSDYDDSEDYEDDEDYDDDSDYENDYNSDEDSLTSYSELTSDVDAKKGETVIMEGYIADCQKTSSGYVCVIQIEGMDNDMVILYADYSICNDVLNEGYWIMFKGLSAGYLKYNSGLGVITAPSIKASAIEVVK